MVATFSGKLGFLNRQISIAFHKAFLMRARNVRNFDLSGVKLEKDEIVSLSKRKEYQFFLFVAIGYLLVHTYISGHYTINILNAPQSTDNQPSFVLYLLAVLQQLSGIWEYELIPVIAAFTISLVLFFLSLKNKRRVMRKGDLVGYATVTLFAVLLLYVVGSFTAVQYAKYLAYGNIDSISSKLNNSNDAKSLKIIADDKEVLDALKKASGMPKIIGNSDKLNETILLAVISDQSNRSSFYKQILLPSAISDKKVNLKTPSDVFLLPDGSLVIRELKKDTIESISPTLGRLMVRGYFDPKYIKEEPQILVMGRQEYLKFREDQINEQLAEIGKYITNAQSLINSTYANINEDKQKIESNKTGLSNSVTSKESDYNNCKTAGYTSYYFGTFYRYYTDSECDARRAQWDQIIAGFQKNITDWEQSLKIDQYNLGEYQKTKDLLVKYRDLVATQKDNAPGELGIFESPDKIKVVLESTSDKAIADYFAIVVHEYLHYSSYVSEERSLPQFFEEGLTEYYSRQIVTDQIKTETSIGYPTIVPIIKKIAQDLPKDELERIYFTKDEKTLIGLLNQKYGDSFYKDSEYYFQIIPFLSGPDALEIVNNILFKIGGPKLTEQDLYSSFSSFDSTSK
ncbi:MAG: hypothetical protein HYW45_04260 [Candidatus Daviesbacteria bacterium]|nr:MAG: hypothetical protein HYW45_04260 [Candidatus Daviesbacteria bacterium]